MTTPANTSESSRKLLPHHLATLRDGSAISEDVIERRGYFSISSRQEALDLGFSHQQARGISKESPALIIPYYNPDGTLATYSMRPDVPRVVEDKTKKKLSDGTYPQKVFKYEMVKGSGNVLDCHPDIVPHLRDPGRSLFFTEGAKKADTLISKGFLAINLNGVWGWRGTNGKQGKTALGGFDDLALNGRKCILLFDSDVRTNENVKGALRRFKVYLEGKGARVIPVLLPQDGDEGKTGIDDYFASGKTAADLEQLITYYEAFTPDLGQGRIKWTTEQFKDLFSEWGYHFAMNSLCESIEVNGKALDDTELDKIEARLMDESIPCHHARKAITTVADENRYHPIKDYLRSLQCDGTSHIDLLATFFIDEDGVFRTYLRLWLIGAVARVMEDGEAQNFMLVLDGGQGLGKSYLAKWLCPDGKYFIESPVNPDDKDCRLNLTKHWIWEVGELGAVTRRADREALKQFVTARRVSERPAYGRLPVDKPAISSFVGTINNESGFLDDPTGSRRYAVCTLTSIDWMYTKLDVNQIWAEAYQLYLDGEPYTFTPEENEMRYALNEKYQVEEPLEALVSKHFEVAPNQVGEEWAMTSPEILGIMDLSQDDKRLVSRVTTVLKGLGLTRDKHKTSINGTRVRFWRGLRQKGQSY